MNMNLSYLDHPSLLAFSLLFIRVVGLIFAAPFFGNRAIPKRTKVGFSLILAGLLFPFIPSPPPVPDSPLLIALAVVKELLIGIILGFAVFLLFQAVVFFGQIVSYQMGFAIVSSIDPESQQRVPIIGQFEYLLVSLVFLAVNGHHLLLSGLYSSLRVIPLGRASLGPSLLPHLIGSTKDVFVIALRLGAPAIAALLFSDLIMGLMARAIPQMNVFIIGYPIRIGVGFLALAFGLPLLVGNLHQLFRGLGGEITTLLRLLAP